MSKTVLVNHREAVFNQPCFQVWIWSCHFELGVSAFLFQMIPWTQRHQQALHVLTTNASKRGSTHKQNTIPRLTYIYMCTYEWLVYFWDLLRVRLAATQKRNDQVLNWPGILSHRDGGISQGHPVSVCIHYALDGTSFVDDMVISNSQLPKLVLNLHTGRGWWVRS